MGAYDCDAGFLNCRHRRYRKGLVALCHFFNHLLFLTSFITCSEARVLGHRFLAQQEKPPRDAEPRIELRPALQQANALPTELRRTLTELRSTLSELRSTLTELKTLYILHDFIYRYLLTVFIVSSSVQLQGSGTEDV